MSNLLNKVADALNPGRDETNKLLYGSGPGSHFPHDGHMPGEFPETPYTEGTQLGEPHETGAGAGAGAGSATIGGHDQGAATHDLSSDRTAASTAHSAMHTTPADGSAMGAHVTSTDRSAMGAHTTPTDQSVMGTHTTPIDRSAIDNHTATSFDRPTESNTSHGSGIHAGTLGAGAATAAAAAAMESTSRHSTTSRDIPAQSSTSYLEPASSTTAPASSSSLGPSGAFTSSGYGDTKSSIPATAQTGADGALDSPLFGSSHTSTDAATLPAATSVSSTTTDAAPVTAQTGSSKVFESSPLGNSRTSATTSPPLTSTFNHATTASSAPNYASSGATNAVFAPGAIQNLHAPTSGTGSDDASTASIKSGFVGYPANDEVPPPRSPSAGATTKGAVHTSSSGRSTPTTPTRTPQIPSQSFESSPTSHEPSHKGHRRRTSAVLGAVLGAALGTGAAGGAGLAAQAYPQHKENAAAHRRGSSVSSARSSTSAYGSTLAEKHHGSAAITHESSTARTFPLGGSNRHSRRQSATEQYGTATVAGHETARRYALGSSSPTTAAAPGSPTTATGRTSHEHHYGRDAALTGAGIGAVGAAHEASRDADTTGPVHDSNLLNKLDPRVRTGDSTGESTTGAGSHLSAGTEHHSSQHTSAGSPTTARNVPYQAQQSSVPSSPLRKEHHHTGRDAALVGAGGAATYSAVKHHEHDDEADPEKKKKGGFLSKLTHRHHKNEKTGSVDESSSRASGMAYVPPTGSAVHDKHKTTATSGAGDAVDVQQQHHHHRDAAAVGAGALAGGAIGERALDHHSKHANEPAGTAYQQSGVTHQAYQPTQTYTQPPEAHSHEKHHSEQHKHEHHYGRDTAVTGVAAEEASKHRHHREDSLEHRESGGEKKQGLISKIIHGRKGDDHGLPKTSEEKGRKLRHEEQTAERTEHHHGRDAAIVGGAGAAAYGAKHHHDAEKEKPSELGSYTEEDYPPEKEGLLHRLTHRKKPSNEREERHAHEEGSRYARDAGLAGAGFGVGGLATHEAEKHHQHTHSPGQLDSPTVPGFGTSPRQGHGSPTTGSYGNAASQGHHGSGLQGYGSSATQDYSNPVSHGYGTPATQGFGNAARQPEGGISGHPATQPTARIAAEPSHQHHHTGDAIAGVTAGAVGLGGYDALQQHHQQQSVAAAAPTSTAHYRDGTNMDDPALKQTGAMYPHPADAGNDVGYGMASSQPIGGIEGTPAGLSAIKEQEQERIDESNKHMHHSSLLNKLDPRVKTHPEGDTGAAAGTHDYTNEPHGHHYGRDAAAVGGAAAVAGHEHHKHHGQAQTAGTSSAPLGVDPQDPYRTVDTKNYSYPYHSSDTAEYSRASEATQTQDGSEKNKHLLGFLHRETSPDAHDRKHHNEPGFQQQAREHHNREVDNVEQLAGSGSGSGVHRSGTGKLRKPPPEGYYQHHE